MDIEDSSLWREVKSITQDTQNKRQFMYEATVHANGKLYPSIKVLSIDTARDYEGSFADAVKITMMFGIGTYSKEIYPYKENLEITVKKRPYTSIGQEEDVSQIFTERYIATPMGDRNPVIEANAQSVADATTLDLTDLVEVSFQLINKTVEQLRSQSVGGVYRNTYVDDVIRIVLDAACKSVEVEEAYRIKSIDIHPSNNDVKREHVVLPHGTRLMNVPTYLQLKCGGVYGSGLGSYIQQGIWYIYPLYDVTRNGDSDRILTIINVPSKKMPSLDTSYREEGSSLTVLATGDAAFIDKSNTDQMNYGNGVRYARADAFIADKPPAEGNKVIMSRAENNNEYLSSKRESGQQIVNSSSERIQSNNLQTMSNLAKREGSVFTVNWEYSNPDLIFPGMVVRVKTLVEDEIKILEGSLLFSQSYVHLLGKGLTADRYVNNTALTIFVKRKIQ